MADSTVYSTGDKRSSTCAAPVGLVGLGLIGTELIKLMRARDIEVIGWDIDAAQRLSAEQLGASSASGAANLFERCATVLLSLPHDGIVRQLLTEVALRPGQLIVDCSTGAADAAVSMWQECARADVEYVDATLSGSSAQLAVGQAVFMVGATDIGWARVAGLLQALSPAVYHVGQPGCGAQMKLITNLVLGLNRAALAEGLALARATGLELELTLKMLRATPAYSRIMDTKGEKMIREEFTPQARLSQHLKDVRLMLELSGQHHLELPLTEAHRRILERAEELGFGPADNSALIKFYDPSR